MLLVCGVTPRWVLSCHPKMGSCHPKIIRRSKRQSTPLKRTAKLDTQGSVTFSLHFVEAVAGDLNA